MTYEITCWGCNAKIPNNESYFSGYMIPLAHDTDGNRRFGCSPQFNYCSTCLKLFPCHYNLPSTAVDSLIDSLLSQEIEQLLLGYFQDEDQVDPI